MNILRLTKDMVAVLKERCGVLVRLMRNQTPRPKISSFHLTNSFTYAPRYLTFSSLCMPFGYPNNLSLPKVWVMILILFIIVS